MSNYVNVAFHEAPKDGRLAVAKLDGGDETFCPLADNGITKTMSEMMGLMIEYAQPLGQIYYDVFVRKLKVVGMMANSRKVTDIRYE